MMEINKGHSFEVEYEIPPMRAIYRQIVDGAADEEMVRCCLEAKQPKWRIRKITKLKEKDGEG